MRRQHTRVKEHAAAQAEARAWLLEAHDEAARLGVKIISNKVLRDAYIMQLTPHEAAQRAVTHYRNNVATREERKKF